MSEHETTEVGKAEGSGSTRGGGDAGGKPDGSAAPPAWSADFGPLAEAVEEAVDELREARVVARIWERDWTVWRPDPEEIEDRLRWLDAPWASAEFVPRLEAFARAARADGLERAVLLGMGGSSLAPEVLARVIGPSADGLDLDVLDTTDPVGVGRANERLDPATTLFVVSSKSGTTVETRSLERYFHRRMVEALGEEAAGRRFVAVTDPGSALAEEARARGYREVFEADPGVGGRYSALTAFGLVPGALLGVDLPRLLERARGVAEACRVDDPGANPGARLGAALGALARAGRDKLVLLATPAIAPYAAWVEQLIAESTGKDGTGILPVPRDRVDATDGDLADRFFVRTVLDGDTGGGLAGLARAGHPVARIPARDACDLGGLFFLWEFATAVAGRVLGIHPFDQPNVEAAKTRARETLDAWRKEGRLPERPPTAEDDALAVRGDVGAGAPGPAVAGFLDRARPRGYVAIGAYLPPGPDVDAALERLAAAVRRRTGVATTIGYGPRYLHSTGQLHKGDAGRGLFLLVTADSEVDVPIPEPEGEGPSPTFGVLERAQALGDRRALEEAGRKVLGIHLKVAPVDGLDRLAAAVRPSR